MTTGFGAGLGAALTTGLATALGAGLATAMVAGAAFLAGGAMAATMAGAALATTGLVVAAFFGAPFLPTANVIVGAVKAEAAEIKEAKATNFMFGTRVYFFHEYAREGREKVGSENLERESEGGNRFPRFFFPAYKLREKPLAPSRQTRNPRRT